MPNHLQKAIERLKTQLLDVGARVEENLRTSIEALNERYIEKAQQVIGNDDTIDEMEVEVEEECLKILALHQPVAVDLRFIVATLKINNDLERIGDLTVNVAERTLFVSQHPPVKVNLDFQTMAAKAQWMLTNSLKSLVDQNLDLAKAVYNTDDEVDDMNRDMHTRIQNAIRESPEDIEVLTHLLSTSRHLERIADLATNIAEDVIYMIEGRIIRHRAKSYFRE